MAFFDFTKLSDSGKSSLRAYCEGTDTVVLHVWDAESFSDGVHEARVELPLAQFLDLAHKVRMEDVSG